jgi:hypothetical protein
MTDNLINTAPNMALVAMQHEVQRKLGRCVLRVQQYERLMKAMLARMALEGTEATIESSLTVKATEVSEKSLGVLLQNYFLKEFLVDSGTNSDQTESAVTFAESQAIAAGLPYFKFRFQMQMSPEDFERTKHTLLNFRDLRNAVVHKLLDRFDIYDESGCLGAIAYLDTSYVTFDAHCIQLKEWAEGMARARSSNASSMGSQVFEDSVINGINPGGSIDWPASGIVQALREAEKARAEEGWTLLDTAINWLRTDHSEQRPTKYQCKTWKPVLQRSKQFEIRVVVDPVSNHRQTWFRSSPAA